MNAVHEQLKALKDDPALALISAEVARVLDQEKAARQAFHEKIQPGDRWEFINGETVVHSPVQARHARVVSRLSALMARQVAPLGGEVFTESPLVSFSRNDYQPDLIYYGAEKAAGIDGKTLRFPVPELVVEVLSPSTERNDRGIKFRDYAAHGVPEYWIIDPDAECAEQYALRDGAYELRLKLDDGLLRCEGCPAIAIPVRALFDAAVFAAAITSGGE